MTAIGVIVFAATAFWIVYRVYSANRPFSFPKIGYAGAAGLIVAEVLLFLRVEFVTIYFTPIAWTAYIAWADSAVYSLRGRSLLQSARGEFACLAIASIPLWLIFEAYNLRLQNWIYVGLPENTVLRGIGYAWAFATIWPAIFETASLVRATGKSRPLRTPAAGAAKAGPAPARRQPVPRSWLGPALIAVGTAMLVVPVLVPPGIGAYLFGAVWLGFLFLMEPVNLRMGNESLWRDARTGDYSRIIALLAAGWICGIFWEFWNWWAEARWVYIFPILQDWKLFAMPLPGYLGFPPFAAECFVLFAFLAPLRNRAAGKSEANKRWLVLEL
jgi:hypothetical protein